MMNKKIFGDSASTNTTPAVPTTTPTISTTIAATNATATATAAITGTTNTTTTAHNKRKSREEDLMNDENQPPPAHKITATVVNTTNKPTLTNVNAHKLIRLDYQMIDNEIQSRCDELRLKSEIEIQHLKLAHERQLAKLPQKVREMTLNTFVKQYGLDMQQVCMENSASRQNEFEKWVAATPRLPMNRKKEVLSSQVIDTMSNPSSQPRLTRAQARKQGIAI